MSTTNVINYRLAVTIARITTSVNVTTDKYGPITQEAVAEAMLSTIGDPRAAATLTIKSTAFRDLSSSIGLTDDLRLTSATSESTGQLGAVLSKTLGVASTLVGVLAAAALVAPPQAGVEYAKAHPRLAGERESYQALLADVSAGMLANAKELAVASPESAQGLMAVQRRLRLLRSEIEGELVRLGKHYDLWREGARSTRTSQHSADLTTDSLPMGGGAMGAGALDVNSLEGALLEVWTSAGAMVTIDGLDDPKTLTPPTAKVDGIWLRIPRPVVWRLWRREVDGEDEGAVLVKMGVATVVDNKCNTQFIEFRRSLWARRMTKVEFSDAGGLKSFESAADSSASCRCGSRRRPAGIAEKRARSSERPRYILVRRT